MRIVNEAEFREAFIIQLPLYDGVAFVTGPGRSGAIAAVYASHHLGIPFVPYKCCIPDQKVLIVDTAKQTGKTLRKAEKWYTKQGCEVVTHYGYRERPGEHIRFWYEELSLQRGKGREYR